MGDPRQAENLTSFELKTYYDMELPCFVAAADGKSCLPLVVEEGTDVTEMALKPRRDTRAGIRNRMCQGAPSALQPGIAPFILLKKTTRLRSVARDWFFEHGSMYARLHTCGRLKKG